MLLTIKLIADNGTNVRKTYSINVFSEYGNINIKTQFGKINGEMREKVFYMEDTNSALRKIRKLLTLRKWKGKNTGRPYTLSELTGKWIDTGIIERELITSGWNLDE